MPIRQISGTDIDYFLILFDEAGKERPEADGTLLSDAIRARLADRTAPVTDVFVASHGWQGDVPAAIAQYDNWISAMASCGADLGDMADRRPGFNPMLIGLHWPSLPWGMETVPPEGAAVLSLDHEADIAMLASQLGDGPEARAAIDRILSYADVANTPTLTPAIEDDFATLFSVSGLRTGSSGGRPGADQDGFDPQAIVTQSESGEAGTDAGAGEPHLLGLGGKIKEAILSPLRQLSFWKMKDRARMFGETGAHALLDAMQVASPDAHFHLMGHSFGCIVVSGMVAGGAGTPALRRPVDTLFLVQGALSLWAYAADVPYAPGTPGYFRRILEQHLVRGPLVTTRSVHDSAVGKFYPLGAGVKGQFLLGDDFPKYGGIGAFGIQGEPATVDMPIASVDLPYDFSEGRIFNLEASNVIKNGDGPAGAHSDIAHPEVAHVFWAAAIAGLSNQANRGGESGGGGRILSPGVPFPASASPPPSPPVAVESPGISASPPPSVSRGAKAAPPPPPQAGFEGGLLGIDEPTAAATPGPAAVAPPSQPRWINAGFEGVDAGAPIVQGQWYTLAFDIDEVKRATAAAAVTFVEEGLFAPDAREIVLTVQVDTDDFDISGHVGQIRVPRAGKSFTKARFDVSPLKNGPCSLKATILKDGQFIQQMDLVFAVGQPGTPAAVTTRGRSLEGIAVLQPRDLSLQIYPGIGNSYECVVCGPVATRVRLPITPGLIDTFIVGARADLMKVVMYQDAQGKYLFQRGIDIPQEATDKALQIMARTGALLMMKLFEGAGAGDDVRAVGKALRQLSTDPRLRLKIQIVAETLPIPWSLLYMGDVSGKVPLDWNNFLGMRHIVEQIPLQNPMAVMEPEIASAPQLSVSLNFNAGIDAQMGADFVQSQRAFWTDRAGRIGVRVTDRATPDDFIGALGDPQTPDQILYLYCHAVSKGLTEAGGPGASSLALNEELISLNDLELRAPRDVRLAGKPLVFINACESAEMSPTFYDGFAPYFMDKGARGVIGTECKTPALFAKEWAGRFFERFLAGEPLGEAVLGLRREFLEQHGNPMGLLYAVYCDADTAIRPALT
ncbi:CHAT domain-containing protein [Cupriavidus sp. YR651]|uniref:CHAT domain-containing protein n=1 Tax=Cupriavidus sp. YR651 TaxID=1855315 RepID=UPI00088F0A51|nr:CHAT domain-containing protein [Cupriavidus sp. YR651]SDD73045.1 CHAT domain-containing protein [Cupriavidus sp. YR651]